MLFREIISSLDKFAVYFLPEYLPVNLSSWQVDPLLSTWANKIDGLSLRSTDLPRRTAIALLQYRLSTKNVDSLARQDFDQFDRNFLKVATRKLWNAALKTDYIDKGVLQRLADDLSSGYLEDGDVTRDLYIYTRAQFIY